jgi:predicted RNA-binding protein with PUA-like domain
MASKSLDYWLVKSEPGKYSWTQFLKDGKTVWDGVRNYQARNNLKLMKKGDQVLFYHSNKGTEVVGIAVVSKTHFQDPTTHDPQWVSVELKPEISFKNPVSLSQIKSDSRFDNIGLVRQSRLSVMPIQKEEFDAILELSF